MGVRAATLVLLIFAFCFVPSQAATPTSREFHMELRDNPPVGALSTTMNQTPDRATIGGRIGDTQETIRLIGIDIGDPGKWQCQSWEAFDRINELIPQNSEIYVETGHEVRDGNGDLYAFVWYRGIDRFQLLNQTLLAEGLGSYVEPDADHATYTDSLKSAAIFAKDNSLGIWGSCGGDVNLALSPCKPIDQNLLTETDLL